MNDEKEWEEFFESKREEFARMAAKAREDDRQGLTRPLEDLLSAEKRLSGSNRRTRFCGPHPVYPDHPVSKFLEADSKNEDDDS